MHYGNFSKMNQVWNISKCYNSLGFPMDFFIIKLLFIFQPYIPALNKIYSYNLGKKQYTKINGHYNNIYETTTHR